jgi:hypothetical protein
VSKRLLLLPCLLILSVLVLAACGSGSGDESKIEETIEKSATATDPADCTKLETQQFMEQTTQESGKAAVKSCEAEAEKEEGAESAAVSNVEVEGSGATAEVALTGGSLDGQTLEVELVEAGDQWKLNEVVKFTKFDQAKLIETFEGDLAEAANEVSPKFAACFIETFKQDNRAEIEELIFGSGRGFEEVAENCS